MSDEGQHHAALDDTPPTRRRRWPWIVAGALVGLPALVLAAWTMIALSYTYSSGDRAGYIQKLSKKGWICKTWEGELAMTTVPGVAPELWGFTVRDDEVARHVNSALGKRVTLHYREHPGVPTTCFGQTPYYVDAVRPLP